MQLLERKRETSLNELTEGQELSELVLPLKTKWENQNRNKPTPGDLQLGHYCPLGDIWQFLGTLVVVINGRGGATGISELKPRCY